MDLSLRPLDESDTDAFIGLDDAAFSVRSTEAQRQQSLASTEWSSMLGAFDGGRLCGVTGSYAQRLTVPGGRRVDVAGVTAVGVLPTHRRRGILTDLMARQLDDVADSGRSLAVLTASEATIYRRFGYGLASRHQSARVVRARSAFADPVSSDWTLRLVDDDEAVKLGPDRFEAHLADRLGGMTRPDGFWPAIFGTTATWVGGGEHFTVICDPPEGDPRPGGYALYHVRREGPSGHWVTVVKEVVAADPDAEAALWRFLLDIDLTDTTEISLAPLDDALPWRLADWRAYQVTGQSDFLWIRILDPVAALSARRYGSDEAMVLELRDDFAGRAAGRYRLSCDGDGVATVEQGVPPLDPDLIIDVADLGSLYLGDTDASTLARAGRLRTASARVLLRADRLFSTERAPFTLTHF